MPLGVTKRSILNVLSLGDGTVIIKLLILFFKIWKHIVSIASSSPTNLSCLNATIPMLSAERIPEIGEDPDFILESVETVDWELVEEEELTPPKIVCGSQVLYKRVAEATSDPQPLLS